MWIKKVWIQISWLLMKPADLDLHYLKKKEQNLEKIICSELRRLNMVFLPTESYFPEKLDFTPYLVWHWSR